MRKNVVETVMGGVVLIVAALFVIFAYRYTGADIQTTGYYELWGAFDRMDGLQTGRRGHDQRHQGRHGARTETG